MFDPRLNGSHLGVSRHDLYYAAVDELLEYRGQFTSETDPLAALPLSPIAPIIWEAPPPGGTYLLVSLDNGRQHRLRVGINAIGRYAENDVVLKDHAISRRHCVVLVHATGGCEVYDTASRNGTWVNSRKVERVDLLPGDVLKLCPIRFLVAWLGPEGEMFSSGESSDTQWIASLSS
jgi:pSer/pThr/pTyr-binding forkhead associated (FHA) protein